MFKYAVFFLAAASFQQPLATDAIFAVPNACWKVSAPKPPSSAVCPANTLAVDGNVCIQDSCPAQVPYSCGILCTKDGSTCTNDVAKVTALLFEMIEKE